MEGNVAFGITDQRIGSTIKQITAMKNEKLEQLEGLDFEIWTY